MKIIVFFKIKYYFSIIPPSELITYFKNKNVRISLILLIFMFTQYEFRMISF